MSAIDKSGKVKRSLTETEDHESQWQELLSNETKRKDGEWVPSESPDNADPGQAWILWAAGLLIVLVLVARYFQWLREPLHS